MSLKDSLHLISNPVERRLFKEYAAVMATTASPPPTIIFDGESAVTRFQSSLLVSRRTIGSYEMELQSAAMEALVKACDKATELGATISARCADSGRRSYQGTVDLWLRNVERGLNHWLNEKRISSTMAETVRRLAPFEQVQIVLELEDNDQVYFGTYFDKSILSSVAAPGASQHLSLLAFDLAEYKDEKSEQALGANGWFRTVVSDLPHFTYLGRPASELPEQGLKQIVRMYDGCVYGFWTADV